MIIGLTGKSCSGKNYIGLLISRLGFEVWDLDVEASKIRKEKKDTILSVFGTNDKTELSSIVFNDVNKLRLLENIIYPELRKKTESYKGDLVINGATLYRSELDSICKGIIYVDASYETRLKRALVRDGISEKEFQMREAAQNDIDYRDVNYRCPVEVVNNDENFKPQDLDRALKNLLK